MVLLGRQGSSAEVNTWVSLVQSGRLTLDIALEDFFASPEFAARALGGRQVAGDDATRGHLTVCHPGISVGPSSRVTE